MAAEIPHFDDIFGGAERAVDFSPVDNLPELPMPEENDDLATIANKLAALAALVVAGKSVAVRTGYYRGSAYTTRDPVELARASMTPQELRQFNVWEKGARMPEFDFALNRKPIRNTEANRKRYERRARAMNKIWKTDVAVAENAMWVSTNLSSVELAEIQTAHRAVATATTRLNHVKEQMRRLTTSINSSCEIMQAREHALKRKIKGYKPRQGILNNNNVVGGSTGRGPTRHSRGPDPLHQRGATLPELVAPILASDSSGLPFKKRRR
ncbi:hypothetical protein CGRA01v4_00940 [Colletotrichum graminicola]|nr:hypothetical protein CGRA01v4_00940 [Colletotrichum graminicola]